MSQDDIQKTSVDVLMKDVLKTKNTIKNIEELLGDEAIDENILKQKVKQEDASQPSQKQPEE